MDPPPSSSPESCISTQPPLPNHPQLLEISLISAQDLAPVSKSMQAYAVAWIGPARKCTTRTDHRGHKNPTWNDKFVFNADADGALTVEIYTVSWFRDVLVGMVKVLVSDLINPVARSRSKSTRFLALQVRRPSGNPQGILNLGVALLDTTMRSMPLSVRPPAKNHVHGIANQANIDEEAGDVSNKELNAKIHMWRSLSVGSSEVANNDDFPSKPGSICNGSTAENSSELCSDIGPSASIVAAEMARKIQPPLENPPNPRKHEHDGRHDTGSSILEELTVAEAQAKGYRRVTTRDRWRKSVSSSEEQDDESELLWDEDGRRRHSRRRSDGGLFSCLVYGIEFTIVCGAAKKNAHGNKSDKKNKTSEASSC